MVIVDECLIFYIFQLRTMTESTWKILKLDRKTPGFFVLPKEWEPCPGPVSYRKVTEKVLENL